ncbi:RICIN domain-containing protein, partial [Streptomyces sp. MCAF7]
LYLGDRWGNSFGGKVNDSRYVWLPLSFPTSRTMTMDWFPQLAIDTEAGTVTGSGGPYRTLVARHSGKCADITSASQTDGTAGVQYTCNGGGNQLFWSKDAGGGYVQLVARHSSQCLTVSGGSADDGAKVVQSACGEGANQQWQATDTGDGYVRLTSRSSGKCLDVADESTADKAAIVQWTCTGGANQQWRRG